MAASETIATSTTQLLDVPVAGGDLRVACYGAPLDSGLPVVLAPHGITANHVSMSLVGAALEQDATLLAPDLRGRGDSGTLPGPFGMAAHADDLVAVLDHLDLDSAPIVGHSMGGFVAVKTALRHPDRVDALLLVDGGLALPMPEDMDVDAILTAVIGPAMDRLSRSFESRDAYHEFWRTHPALGPGWNTTIEAYFDHDVHEADGAWRSRVSLDAVREDGRDTLVDESLQADFGSIEVPIRFVWSPRGIMDADPLYPREIVDQVAAATPTMEVVDLEDVNHYTLALTEDGAEQVAAAVRGILT